MKVIDLSIDKIKPYNKNPRINNAAVKEVSESIKSFGFKQPIVIDKKNVIVIGHTRWLAAKNLKLKKVPVVIADDLLPKQVKALRIADNKVGEIATWDNSLLKDELLGLDKLFTGFNEVEMDSMFFGFEESEQSTSITGDSSYEEVEENEVKLTFIMDADSRDSIIKKLNKVKQKDHLETLSDALIKLVVK